MPRRVFTAPTAALTLADALEWFSQNGSGREAKKVYERLEGAADYLGDFPYAGRECDHEGLYQLVIANHRFLYTIVPDTKISETAGNIEIVAIFRPGQP